MPQICGFSMLGVKPITNRPLSTDTPLYSFTSGLSGPTVFYRSRSLRTSWPGTLTEKTLSSGP